MKREVLHGCLRLLETNPLRSSDAMQIASTLAWHSDRFVSADARQCAAARTSGLSYPALGPLNQLDKTPALVGSQARKLPSNRAEYGRRDDHVLRPGMHVAEQSLERSCAQAGRTGCTVGERRNLMGGPCHVRHRETNHRMLANGKFLAGLQRLLHFLPGFVYQRAPGAINSFGP